MLRHVQSGRVYWFCRTCWQEMPLVKVVSDPPSNGLQPQSLVEAVTLAAS